MSSGYAIGCTHHYIDPFPVATMTNTADLDSYVFEGASQESKDAHLEDFKHDLNDELAKIFPATSRPYNNVQVLLLCWEEADSNNHDDLLYFQKYLEKDFK